jgi:hypothetical protein
MQGKQPLGLPKTGKFVLALFKLSRIPHQIREYERVLPPISFIAFEIDAYLEILGP